MPQIPVEMMKAFGIKAYVPINFETPVKVVVNYNDSFNSKTEVYDNVTSLGIMEAPTCATLEINYQTEKGEGSISSAVTNFRNFVIVNK